MAGVWKVGDFRLKSLFISETLRVRPMVAKRLPVRRLVSYGAVTVPEICDINNVFRE